MSNTTIEQQNVLEALLVAKGESITKEWAMQCLEVTSEQLDELVANLRERYKQSGIAIIETDDAIRIAIAPSVAKRVNGVLKTETQGPLTKATSETLAIIAYMGPVSRNGVDEVRGVNSSSAVRTLLLRKLVEQVENPNDARSSLLQITPECLQYFGVASTSELPSWDEEQKKLQAISGDHSSEENESRNNNDDVNEA